MSAPAASVGVSRVADLGERALRRLLARYPLTLSIGPYGAEIPGSYWGVPEAGLVGATLHARGDTPVHSVLHEACHFVCMTPQRRAALHTDAGGDHGEENAVCYLQIVLAGYLEGYSRAEACADMDAWGYSFRLGSAGAWFERDADDARAFLLAEAVLDSAGVPTWRLRGDPPAP